MVRTESLQITGEMLSLIGEIDEFKGAWRALGTLAPERLRSLRRVATVESVGSSTRIEGAKLSDREVEALLGRIGVQSLLTRDEQEVAGYAAVMETIFANHDAIPITENYILQLHTRLLSTSERDERHRGRYKVMPNRVEAFDASGRSLGVIFETSTPFDTPRHMRELIEWFASARRPGGAHPLVATGVFVVEFLAIHPFQDGNGQLSRALTTLLLLQAGYAYVPYSSLESIIEQNKEEYYLALRRTQLTLRSDAPDSTPWLTFFLRALQSQKRRLEEKVERERIMRSALPELSVGVLELLMRHESASVAEVVRATGAPLGTVKKRLRELAAAGHILPVGKGRSTRYVLGRPPA
ncbi:MAG TPA: Fic family protein [Phycisphaerales bacterium]|nr:Fic family protein [Phycisphaerales bacterium]